MQVKEFFVFCNYLFKEKKLDGLMLSFIFLIFSFHIFGILTFRGFTELLD